MSTVSIWQDTSIWPALPQQREEADVCIIGAGIVGATLATFLTRAGKSVVVLEARDVALGATGRNAGHVAVPFMTHYDAAVARLGRAVVKEAIELGFRNREIVKQFLDDYGVWYEQPGSLALAWDEQEAKELAEAARSLSADGYEIEFSDHDPTGRGFHAGLFRPGGIATQSYWLAGEVMAHSGARVIPNCAVWKIEQAEHAEHAGGIVTVHGQRATVRAAQVCLCTNAYSRTIHPYFADKVFPTRAQMLATAPTERVTSLMMGCEWGFEYFRQLPDGRFLIGGWRNRFTDEEVGYNDHETTPHLQAGLESFIQRYFPELDGVPVTHRWSGIMGFTVDGMPLIGRLPDLSNVYFAVGFTGGGMGIGPATAERAAELMLHGTHPGVFSADRPTATAR